MQPAHESISNGNSDETVPTGVDLSAQMKKLHKLFFLIPIGVIGNIIFTIAASDHPVGRSFMHAAPGYIVIAMILCIVPWFTGSLRLFIWGRFLGKDVRYCDMFKVAIGAELGAAVSPPLIGGSPVKIGMLMQRGFPGGTALSLTVLEGLEDSVFFLIMVPVALSISAAWDAPSIKTVIDKLSHPSVWLSGGAGVVLIVLVMMLRHRVKEIIRRFHVLRTIMDRVSLVFRQFIDTYQDIIRNGKTIFALTMALTAVQWICRYSIISFLLLSLGIPAKPVLFMALQVIVFALTSFIPTPGGAGGAETLFFMIYRSFLPADAIGIVTLGWRFLTFYFLLLLASILFIVFAMKPPEVLFPKEKCRQVKA
jgi:uncharacterized protein (TIRG00374 family)